MASYPLHRMPPHQFNKPSWLMAPDPSMLPIPVFNGTASLSVQRQSPVVIHATVPIPSHSVPSTEPCIFPPPPTYAEVMDMDDNLPTIEAMRRARAIDPTGYVAEAVHPEDLLPPSFDDIAYMEPHLPWEGVMKRAGNIDQAALIRDTISRQGPDGLVTSFEGPSEASSILRPQTVSHRLTVSLPQPTYIQSSMYTEKAARSSLILSSSKDKMREELKAFSTYIAIWLHATITNRSTQLATDTARIWKSWSTFSETVIVIQAIMETLTLDHITVFHGLVHIRRLFRGSYIHEDEAYLRNIPTIIARVFFAGCLLGFKYCQDKYSVRPWASTMGIDRRTAEEIGRHALHGLDYRLDISPNDWKVSLEDLHRFAATCSFPTTSGDMRTVIDSILDKLKIDAPPGIPLRARTGVSEQGSTQPPSLTYILGIFTGAVHSPRIILKAVEGHPGPPQNMPNNSTVGRHTRQNGEDLLSVSVQHPGIRTGQGDIWHAQHIPPDHGSFGMQGNTRNDLPISYGAVMMAKWDIRSNVQFLETQRPPLVSRSVQDHGMIWQSDNWISGQRPVSGGLIFRGPNETNIWALQREEHTGDRWLEQQGSRIASRTSLW